MVKDALWGPVLKLIKDAREDKVKMHTFSAQLLQLQQKHAAKQAPRA